MEVAAQYGAHLHVFERGSESVAVFKAYALLDLDAQINRRMVKGNHCGWWTGHHAGRRQDQLCGPGRPDQRAGNEVVKCDTPQPTGAVDRRYPVACGHLTAVVAFWVKVPGAQDVGECLPVV